MKFRILKEDKVVVASVFVAIILLSVVIIDGSMANKEQFNGTVIDKYFQDGHSNLNIGTITDVKGSSGIISSVEYQSEKFIIVVKTENDHITSINVSSSTYYRTPIGNPIKYITSKGFFTGLTWNSYIFK
ncbi:hypothetical protein [Aquimarina algiphila]|uniref:hypothetical protein n=1 Tax=Aquimarina algiphila TaxID=2047982 RepID=UPI00232BB24D|nr:hypothetical protein [Aquimarina algiphila]